MLDLYLSVFEPFTVDHKLLCLRSLSEDLNIVLSWMSSAVFNARQRSHVQRNAHYMIFVVHWNLRHVSTSSCHVQRTLTYKTPEIHDLYVHMCYAELRYIVYTADVFGYAVTMWLQAVLKYNGFSFLKHRYNYIKFRTMRTGKPYIN